MYLNDAKCSSTGDTGHKFDIKAFHETILRCGAVPLRLLEVIVDDFIAEVGPPTPEPENNEDAQEAKEAEDATNNGDAGVSSQNSVDCSDSWKCSL